MGLLAIVAARARRIGLLPRIIAALPLLSLLCVLVGVSWVAVLPVEGQYRATYLSENALLPHQAITFFRETEWDIVRGVKGQVHAYQNVPEQERNAGFKKMFEDYGLAAYSHEWRYANGSLGGENVYAMMHASRGPHNEAIVIAAPWIGMDGELNEGGVALLLALARFFRRWNFWHKNLIFALPSDTGVALRKWVEAYHTTLQHTAGSIEGAVVLDYEFESEHFHHVEVGFEGLNGQLPNLDLVNVALYCTAAEFARGGILGTEGEHSSYGQRLTTLLRHVSQQALAGIASGCGSEMFSGWRINAVTLKAIPGGHDDITTFGRVCESTVRSINNLLEHFHQSFFFYLMLGPRSFVSIASYLPAVMLVANSFSVMALYLLASSSPNLVTPRSVGIALAGLAAIVAACATTGYIYGTTGKLSALPTIILCSSLVFLRMGEKAKRLLQAFSLVLLGLELTTLAMLNFSLAMGLGVICLPLAWVRVGPKCRLSRAANWVFVFVTCPVVTLSILSHFLLHVKPTDLPGLLVRSHSELSAWTLMLISGVWTPAWVVAATCI